MRNKKALETVLASFNLTDVYKDNVKKLQIDGKRNEVWEKFKEYIFFDGYIETLMNEFIIQHVLSKQSTDVAESKLKINIRKKLEEVENFMNQKKVILRQAFVSFFPMCVKLNMLRNNIIHNYIIFPEDSDSFIKKLTSESKHIHLEQLKVAIGAFVSIYLLKKVDIFDKKIESLYLKEALRNV